MPVATMTTLSVLAYTVPAGILLATSCVTGGLGVIPQEIPGDLFQFGALGLVAFMVWNKERSSAKTARLLDQRHAEMIKMTAQILEALNRNSRAMEICAAKNKPELPP